jgi:hypothetical protein
MNELIIQAHELFKNSHLTYCICGGFALDMFAGKELRPHGDFDMVFFKHQKNAVLEFLKSQNWPVYGRFMETDQPMTQYLFYSIDDSADSKWDECENFWAVKPSSFAEMYPIKRLEGVYSYKIHEPRLQGFDFIELAFDGLEDGDFVLQENPKITLPVERAILYKDGIPYLAPEAVMFYKTDELSSTHPYLKPKTESDFKTIMPLLSTESKKWLFDAIATCYPEGADWLNLEMGDDNEV